MESCAENNLIVLGLLFFQGPDGTAVDIFKMLEIPEKQNREDCRYVVTFAVMAAPLLAGLTAAQLNMQG